MSKLSLYKKLWLLGGILVVVFNGLAVNLWVDFLVLAINFMAVELIKISNYTTVIGFTLIAVGTLLWVETRKHQSRAKLKKSKGKKDNMQYELI
jgi:hypothetical protein